MANDAVVVGTAYSAGVHRIWRVPLPGSPLAATREREHARQPLRPEQPSVRTNVGLNCRTHAQKDGRWLTSEEAKVSRASNMCLRACIVTIITVQTGWREEEDASPGSLGERKEDGAPEIND